MRRVASAVLLALAALAVAPGRAQEDASGMLGDVPPIEQRIALLHDRLAITADQAQAWGLVAEAMRQNDQAVRDSIERYQRLRGALGQELSAPDYLDLLERTTETRAQGILRFSIAFQPLYQVMNEEQKQKADAYFHGRVRFVAFPLDPREDPR
jgi:hypothetical protein